MKTLELLLDLDEGLDGVFAISLVKTPAIQSNFVALSEEQKNYTKLSVADEDKRIIVGLALIPDLPIYRNGRTEDEEDFNIMFSQETVRKTAERYLELNRNHNATLEHESPTEGVKMIESWIVEDPEMDKVNLYGIAAKKGSWAVSMKVHDDDLWQRVKNKEFEGFSIEGMFSNSEVKSSAQVQYEKIMNILKED